MEIHHVPSISHRIPLGFLRFQGPISYGFRPTTVLLTSNRLRLEAQHRSHTAQRVVRQLQSAFRELLETLVAS